MGRLVEKEEPRKVGNGGRSQPRDFCRGKDIEARFAKGIARWSPSSVQSSEPREILEASKPSTAADSCLASVIEFAGESFQTCLNVSVRFKEPL